MDNLWSILVLKSKHFDACISSSRYKQSSLDTSTKSLFVLILCTWFIIILSTWKDSRYTKIWWESRIRRHKTHRTSQGDGVYKREREQEMGERARKHRWCQDYFYGSQTTFYTSALWIQHPHIRLLAVKYATLQNVLPASFLICYSRVTFVVWCYKRLNFYIYYPCWRVGVPIILGYCLKPVSLKINKRM